MPAFIGQRNLHKWHLEGKVVKIAYLGEYEAIGTVVDSRVCYGGTVKHYVRLDSPVKVSFDSEDPYRDAVYILEHFDADENQLLEIL